VNCFRVCLLITRNSYLFPASPHKSPQVPSPRKSPQVPGLAGFPARIPRHLVYGDWMGFHQIPDTIPSFSTPEPCEVPWAFSKPTCREVHSREDATAVLWRYYLLRKHEGERPRIRRKLLKHKNNSQDGVNRREPHRKSLRAGTARHRRLH